ncbi:hypothetical protein CSKR_108890 [Clonorchis sinensis]|uniref:Uncharacterized protein n=1 Tax=Clonorchis sinensis TaxID=79923 RepID=A0A8T1MDT6_CLOSI|nr:hypothetical protein CSKR_108890 [Clonorchis sinensis]
MLATRLPRIHEYRPVEHLRLYRTKQTNRNADEMFSANVLKDSEGVQPTMFLRNIEPEEPHSRDSPAADPDLPPMSTVNLISGKGKRYQVTFRAKEPEFCFLHVRRRKSPDSTMNKAIQACSTDYFVEVRDESCQKYVTRMKRYRIAPCQQIGDIESGDLNQDKTDKGLLKKRKNEKASQNHIYITKDGMTFYLTDFNVKLDYAQPLVSGPSPSVDSQTDSKRGTYIPDPNRAVLMVRFRRDLMRIRFALDELEIKPISTSVSRGAQCTERYAYVKFVPVGEDKVTFCAVPLSTYRYRDPMIAIRRQNDLQRKNGQEPKWLIEQRQKRRQLNATPKDQLVDPQEVHTSVIVFELNGHRVKLRCGHLEAMVVTGQELYDDFVLANKTESRVFIKSPTPTNENSFQENEP